MRKESATAVVGCTKDLYMYVMDAKEVPNQTVVTKLDCKKRSSVRTPGGSPSTWSPLHLLATNPILKQI